MLAQFDGPAGSDFGLSSRYRARRIADPSPAKVSRYIRKLYRILIMSFSRRGISTYICNLSGYAGLDRVGIRSLRHDT